MKSSSEDDLPGTSGAQADTQAGAQADTQADTPPTDSASESDAAEAGGEPVERAEPTFRQILRETYLTFDRRTLGLARIFYGFLLITDLFRRTWAWEDLYSNVGVLPNHVHLWRPQAWGAFTIFNAFSTPAEMWALWGVMLATFFCMLIGFKTRLAQILTVIFVAGMDGRVPLVENGGYVVYNLLALWTCFLPMGDRFSVDAMLASMKARRETSAEDLNHRAGLIDPRRLAPHVSVLGFVLLIQLSAIYFFNVIHKTGSLWRNGTAVHYVLYVDRMVTPIVALVRDYIPPWLIIVLTRFTMAAEAAIPICLLTPLGRVWGRRLAIVLINALHLGFGTAMVLGPFAWACCTFSTLLFTREDWEIAIRTMRRTHRARGVVYPASSAFAFWLCRVLVRMDRYALLTFRSTEGTAWHVQDIATGRTLHGSAALADILAALPLGPTVAWPFRLPGIRHAVDAILTALEKRPLSRFFGLRSPASAVPPSPPSLLRLRARPVLVGLREIAILMMFAAAINRGAAEMWVFNRRFKIVEPEPMRLLTHKFRFLQGWFMFSPEPVTDDGTTVVDALTVDGRRIDPFTGREPSFELTNVKSFRYSQLWCDYLDRIHRSEYSGYRDAMKEYMYRLPERTGRPEDAIVSGDVYWVHELNPRFGRRDSTGYDRQKLFSFVNPNAQRRATNP